MSRMSTVPGFLAALAASALMGLSATAAQAGEVKLSGANEVPPVTTAASGSGSFSVAEDGTLSGSIKTTGIAGTMAHIHAGAAGKNGPVVVPLAKTGDGVWAVPPGTKFTPEQVAQFKAGELYVNVHSEAYKPGEIRAQLTP